MKFSEKLKQAMQQLGINQAQVVGMTGKSKGSISMYLNDKTVPSEQVQSDIAVSLGLAPDYFEQEENPVIFKPSKCEDGIDDYSVWVAANITPVTEAGTDEQPGFTGYEYDLTQYTKDEYIKMIDDRNTSLEDQMTQAQEAMCEIYEMMA